MYVMLYLIIHQILVSYAFYIQIIRSDIPLALLNRIQYLLLFVEAIRGMESNSGFPEKLDALDLIINALKDHEKKLDDLSHRLENIFQSLSTNETGAIKKEEKRTEHQRIMKGSYITCQKWHEFKNTCRHAEIAAFEIESNIFNIYSKVNEDVFKYSEDLPDNNLRVVAEDSYFSIDKSSLNNKIDLLQILIGGGSLNAG